MLKTILGIGTLQTFAIVVNFVRTKMVAVLLGPAGVGIIGTVDQVVQSASYFSALSLPFASVKFLSKAHSESSEAFQRTYASFFRVLLMLSGAGPAIGLALLVFSPGSLGQQIFAYRDLLCVALLGIPAMILGGYFMQVCAAAQKPRYSSYLALITAALSTITSVTGISIAGILGLYVGNVGGGFLLTIGTIIFLWKALDLPFHHRNASFLGELRNNPTIIPFALYLYLGALTYSIAFLVVRYTVLTSYGEAAAGLLHGALALSLIIGLVLNPANGLFLTPMLNRNISKALKIDAATEFLSKLAIVLALFAMPIVLFPDLILTILFSPKFLDAAHHVFLFVISQCAAQLAGVHQALLIGFDDLRAYSALTCIGHIAAGLLSSLLVPYYGISGAAIALILAYSFIFFTTFARLKRTHGCRFSWHLALTVAYAFLSLLSAGLVVSGKLDGWDGKTIMIKVAFYLVFAVTLLFFLRSKGRTGLSRSFPFWQLRRN